MTVLALVFMTLFFGESIFGAPGGADKAHIGSLIWPAVNLGILLALLATKLKGLMGVYFKENSKNIQELYDLAEKKDKEAQIRLEVYQKKMAAFALEEEKIKNESLKDAKMFRENIEQQTKEKIQRIKQEGTDRIKHEKESMMRFLNEELLDVIIQRAKEKVATEQQDRKKITNNLAQLVE